MWAGHDRGAEGCAGARGRRWRPWHARVPLEDGAADSTQYLLKTVRTLEDRLGTLLFQLPPYLKADAGRLGSFLEMIPDDIPAAFEFRQDGWKDEEIHGLLREHGAALCCADTDDTEEDEPIVSTAGWGYFRLRRPRYSDDDLERWADGIRRQEWSHVFVFFKHEDEGAGPLMAARFRELFGEG